MRECKCGEGRAPVRAERDGYAGRMAACCRGYIRVGQWVHQWNDEEPTHCGPCPQRKRGGSARIAEKKRISVPSGTSDDGSPPGNASLPPRVLEALEYAKEHLRPGLTSWAEVYRARELAAKALEP